MRKSVALLITLFILVLLLGCIAESSFNAISNTQAPQETQGKEEADVDAKETDAEKVKNENPLEADLSLKDLVVDGNILVYFIDVGQGDSILVQLGQKNILIDAGENGKGVSSVLPYLNDLNVVLLDLVFGTHAHSDHIGGIDEVMQEIPVKSYYDTNDECSTKTCAGVQSVVKEKNTGYFVAERGQSIIDTNSLLLMVLNPAQPLVFENKNNNSIVLLLRYKGISFLFTGDCEKECEKAILDANENVDVNILKIGHHGSRTASSEEFLDRATPQLAVIQVGEDNDYGHPHEEIIQKLNARNIEILRTDLNGTIKIETDGVNYAVK